MSWLAHWTHGTSLFRTSDTHTITEWVHSPSGPSGTQGYQDQLGRGWMAGYGSRSPAQEPKNPEPAMPAPVSLHFTKGIPPDVEEQGDLVSVVRSPWELSVWCTFLGMHHEQRIIGRPSNLLIWYTVFQVGGRVWVSDHTCKHTGRKNFRLLYGVYGVYGVLVKLHHCCRY